MYRLEAYKTLFRIINCILLFLFAAQTLDQLIAATVPSSIRSLGELSLSKPLTESELIERLTTVAQRNQPHWRSYIGMGYYNCHTPTVIMRNVLENPGQCKSCEQIV